MKNPFSLFFVLCLLATDLHAQEGDGFGFLNIVNLIPGTIPADVAIGGKELIPGGMKSGDFTGWFVVPEGAKTISITLENQDKEKPHIRKESGNIEVGSGLSNIVAMFLQPDPRVKADGTPYPPKIRIKSFPAYESKGYGLKFVSMSPTDQRFQIGPLKLDAKPLDPIEIPKWSGAPFEIMQNGKAIGKAAGSSEAGSFYLFVGTREDGNFITVLTRADPQQTPPWMKKKKTPAEKP